MLGLSLIPETPGLLDLDIRHHEFGLRNGYERVDPAIPDPSKHSGWPSPHLAESMALAGGQPNRFEAVFFADLVHRLAQALVRVEETKLVVVEVEVRQRDAQESDR